MAWPWSRPGSATSSIDRARLGLHGAGRRPAPGPEPPPSRAASAARAAPRAGPRRSVHVPGSGGAARRPDAPRPGRDRPPDPSGARHAPAARARVGGATRRAQGHGPRRRDLHRARRAAPRAVRPDRDGVLGEGACRGRARLRPPRARAAPRAAGRQRGGALVRAGLGAGRRSGPVDPGGGRLPARDDAGPGPRGSLEQPGSPPAPDGALRGRAAALRGGAGRGSDARRGRVQPRVAARRPRQPSAGDPLVPSRARDPPRLRRRSLQPRLRARAGGGRARRRGGTGRATSSSTPTAAGPRSPGSG